jgi:hypothetical protein
VTVRADQRQFNRPIAPNVPLAELARRVAGIEMSAERVPERVGSVGHEESGREAGKSE